MYAWVQQDCPEMHMWRLLRLSGLRQSVLQPHTCISQVSGIAERNFKDEEHWKVPLDFSQGLEGPGGQVHRLEF